jgi:L-threonylcarbamoyladenylate synthase
MGVMRVDDPVALEAAEAALRAGGAIVLPTDTVYGIAALQEHIDVLYELKDRPEAVPIAVLVADAEQAASLGRLDGVARRLADRFWPGPLTLVLPAGESGSTVGVRCPDHPFVRALAARVGPLPTTSANRHGEPTPPTATEAAAALAGEPGLVVDGGPCGGVASTVVDIDGVVLREGALSSSDIAAALH